MAALAQRFGFAAQGGEHRGHRHRIVDDAVLRFQARERQQVFDQLRHALRLALHLGEHRRPFGLVGRIEQVEVTVHDGERRAQFVRDVGDEIAAHVLQAHQLGDVARDEQPQLFRIRDQAQAQARGGIDGRGRVQQGSALRPAASQRESDIECRRSPSGAPVSRG